MRIDTKSRHAIEDVLTRRVNIRSMQEQVKEDIKAIAERLDIKPAQLNKIIGLVEKEREPACEMLESVWPDRNRWKR